MSYKLDGSSIFEKIKGIWNENVGKSNLTN